ncbi:MAG: hypothetical protein CVU07_07065 [Bacteroidetes bacterium HGW-Bacteroidetes-23]|uniref:Gliding motility lipoprotein GldH n=1 Tax=Flavobacterium azooxidireducens TaxID=1871076 RepID=A0ABY4KN24_9FLAO|nr:gliding motility lipoprotein GldH [Flavobacterium azooxidireducens]PKP16396.1 MAG: hypothetical protein CVU07_07065 [Bacteroidetes bacterium HGW-Bacteroidetes-23]UPQ80632.1 gliding motility lipoprotein GldH [Flavobacterium azooxidireducens]
MKLVKPLFFIAFFLLLSCDKSSVYQKIDNDFKDNRWFKTTIKTHTIDIQKESTYTLFFDFRHVHDFQFPEIPIQFRIENPDGTVSVEKINLSIKDENGKDRGECMGDVCDLRQVVFSDKMLTKGKHSISISNQFDGEYLPNVIGIGLRLEEIEKQ